MNEKEVVVNKKSKLTRLEKEMRTIVKEHNLAVETRQKIRTLHNPKTRKYLVDNIGVLLFCSMSPNNSFTQEDIQFLSGNKRNVLRRLHNLGIIKIVHTSKVPRASIYHVNKEVIESILGALQELMIKEVANG